MKQTNFPFGPFNPFSPFGNGGKFYHWEGYHQELSINRFGACNHEGEFFGDRI